MGKRESPDKYRYGIGEWYGRLFCKLPVSDRREFARRALMTPKEANIMCLPRGNRVLCTKKGGVCSLRLYRQLNDTPGIGVPSDDAGDLVTICPYRFLQNGTIFGWIGRELLNHPQPVIVSEIGFLERDTTVVRPAERSSTRDDVGRIDNILVRPNSDPMVWCALEIQAVYFSGPGMPDEFRNILAHKESTVPFPAQIRRPDYRSSGPKRLMPQLQIKVPALRRWGKKMAVVVDENFFSSLGHMDSVGHVSNADIAWFVVGYEETEGSLRLRASRRQFTTLERAVEGLTAGQPVSQEVFESRIAQKLTVGRVTDPTSVDLD